MADKYLFTVKVTLQRINEPANYADTCQTYAYSANSTPEALRKIADDIEAKR